MPRISVVHVKKEEVIIKPENKQEEKSAEKVENLRDPRFPTELTTDEEIRKKSGGPIFSSFCAYPQKVHFAGEHNDEDIILLLRAHRVTMIPWLLGTFGLALLPVVVLPLIAISGVFPNIGVAMESALVALWYLGTFTYAYLNTLFWYFNVGIVTSERVVDIDWNSIVHHDVSTALVSKIQDARGEQSGVMASVFDFGNVHVQTAGNDPNVEFVNVPHPQIVVRKIQELMQNEEKEWEHNPGA